MDSVFPGQAGGTASRDGRRWSPSRSTGPEADKEGALKRI